MNKIINKKKYILNRKDLKIINKIKSHYEHSHAASIEVLIYLQKQYGWISDDIIYIVAKLLNISPAEIDSIATFYSQIFRYPVGKYIIKYCDSVVCYITGYEKILKIIKHKLKIIPGETTVNGLFTLLPICCLGLCDKSPSIMINNQIYTSVSKNDINQILDKYINEKIKS
ncbi:NADH-quinone oxidoreductase subunit NuoE [Enterobacteriaceae endosymbiont of Plateumaris consimilis]|uniref:NADH-quinone oxidoreductase subunit NuoE n=1 Tax=Enterobacteriaceae endosymbiont of Plateumaris consimilis TaxID=2675794 RepID=UPI0014493B56|nr:NADH-quinone oxidoreductase subunit NuoE [Enterobacteriaceae endosymbiont of Plateumaris consimilis]QJC28773.1 NADH-quinone oxidoreductase subunit NuoE [Enterobacteriaceae endosymbiont of Plateumaris consimilis]